MTYTHASLKIGKHPATSSLFRRINAVSMSRGGWGLKTVSGCAVTTYISSVSQQKDIKWTRKESTRATLQSTRYRVPGTHEASPRSPPYPTRRGRNLQTSGFSRANMNDREILLRGRGDRLEGTPTFARGFFPEPLVNQGLLVPQQSRARVFLARNAQRGGGREKPNE